MGLIVKEKLENLEIDSIELINTKEKINNMGMGREMLTKENIGRKRIIGIEMEEDFNIQTLREIRKLQPDRKQGLEIFHKTVHKEMGYARVEKIYSFKNQRICRKRFTNYQLARNF